LFTFSLTDMAPYDGLKNLNYLSCCKPCFSILSVHKVTGLCLWWYVVHVLYGLPSCKIIMLQLVQDVYIDWFYTIKQVIQIRN